MKESRRDRNDSYYYETRDGRRREEKRGRTFGDVLRFLLMLIALGVFLYSAWMLYGFYKEYKKGSDEYDNLESSYTVSKDDENESENFDALEDDLIIQRLEQIRKDGKKAEFEEVVPSQSVGGREVKEVVENGKQVTLPVMTNPINFDELLEVNDDIVGWLKVRALDISYPVVQGEDNDFYLHRTFEKTDNFAGCLFMNYTNRRDLTDQNTIIYGHNMKNGSMFGKLKNFNDEEVFNKSKFFWIFTPDLIYQYRIFSAGIVSTTGNAYNISFTDEDYEEFIADAFERSVVDNKNVEVTTEDRVVTLSTCTGDYSTRFVVVGKLAQIYAAKNK